MVGPQAADTVWAAILGMRMPTPGNPKKDREIFLKAFHPAYKLNNIDRTLPAILQQARHIALTNGLKHVYLGNVHDREGGITACGTCGEPLIQRDWHRILHYRLDADGACPHCR